MLTLLVNQVYVRIVKYKRKENDFAQELLIGKYKCDFIMYHWFLVSFKLKQLNDFNSGDVSMIFVFLSFSVSLFS